MPDQANPHLFVDADACPVKDEIYRVAARHGLNVTLVANRFIAVPREASIRLQVVPDGPDVADDWIAEHVGAHDVVVTADIPLAARSLEKGAAVIGTTGRPFTSQTIGAALASRELMSHLREVGEITGGPRPFAPKDRSRFLQELEHAVTRAKRALAETAERPAGA
ncbi:YaiI/YqxD family protein [Methylopila sp. M107]|uniref:YaiI/YqxD family protein n=1 Tax=Methylopila sp. M107 TaxID=1101190 RepID=UPI00036095AD|nr:YaiI/YqxD family protein [Methylopila sp. M107]